jgi:hypothetical protein
MSIGQRRQRARRAQRVVHFESFGTDLGTLPIIEERTAERVLEIEVGCIRCQVAAIRSY